MNRREFLIASVLMPATSFTGTAPLSAPDSEPSVETVLGPVPATALGVTLPHEHVMVDFIGADRISRERYNPDEAFSAALPHLLRVKEAGCKTLFECTPAYIGRDPQLLKRLAQASGIQLVTNTGYYGAAEDKYVPAFAYQESVDQLAYRWITEARQGIEGTGIKPGFTKIGVDNGPLSEIDRKLVKAAGLAHLETGLTIAAHTGNSAAALEQVRILREVGVAPWAWIWVHARQEEGSDALTEIARQGGWVEIDNIGPESADQCADLVSMMKDRGRLNRVLVSQDAGWYHVGEPGGGTFRPFDFMFREFLPKLRGNGFTESEIQMLVQGNPAEAFGIRVRKL